MSPLFMFVHLFSPLFAVQQVLPRNYQESRHSGRCWVNTINKIDNSCGQSFSGVFQIGPQGCGAPRVRVSMHCGNSPAGAPVGDWLEVVG